MAKGRQLKGRIRSVQNTRKITRTMELVATSKLKRAQDRVVAARPYAEALREVHRRPVTPELAERFPAAPAAGAAGKGGPTRAAVILLTSNRGLAGGFNANLIKEARRRIEALEARGLHGRPPRRRQEGRRLLQVPRPDAGRASASDIGDKPDAPTTPPSSSTPLIDGVRGGRAGAGGPGARRSSSARSPRRRPPSGSSRSSRRRPRRARRARDYILAPDRRRDPRPSCFRSTCATRSTAGWSRPARPSTARGAPP